MQAEDFVSAVRSTQLHLLSPLLPCVSYLEAPDESGDQNATFRMLVLEVLRRTLMPEDREIVRFLLKQEIAYHEDGWGIFEGIRLCGFLLSTFAQVEDIDLLWQAKTANFDTMCGFDVQILVGAGVSTTLAYLQHLQEEWAASAKEYIEECQKAGDFRDLESYRAAMHAYFGRNKIR